MSEFHLKWIWSRFLDFYGVDCIELDKLLKIGCLMVGIDWANFMNIHGF